jgi:predicted small metal-binding protein
MSATPTPARRKFIDCREFPSERNCTVRISGTEDEVLDVAVRHATASHGHENTPELREEIRKLLKDDE